ncbi:MAG: DUF2628 domain-containing protein [Rhizobiales bacterium]|nr:DUF2628 domain-containing protein [Hyphomicrobiales bacterium]
MTVYTIHRKPGAPPEDAVFVADGFSGWAFLFGPVWALWHRMWVAAAILLAVQAAISVSGPLAGFGDLTVASMGLAASLIFGFEAQALRMAALRRAGWKETGLATGASTEEAELNYFLGLGEGLVREASIVPQALAPRHSTDPLGLFGAG